jgi:hypothetical protein
MACGATHTTLHLTLPVDSSPLGAGTGWTPALLLWLGGSEMTVMMMLLVEVSRYCVLCTCM